MVSELRKGARGNAAVRAWAEAVNSTACFLSRITLAEIRFGIERAPDPAFRAELEAWIRDGLQPWFRDRILEVDEAVLVAWRRLSWAGQMAGYTYAMPDALIAATALTHELAVVTRNVSDFDRAGVTVLNPWKLE